MDKTDNNIGKILHPFKYVIGRTICWFLGLSKEDIETLTKYHKEKLDDQ